MASTFRDQYTVLVDKGVEGTFRTAESPTTALLLGPNWQPLAPKEASVLNADMTTGVEGPTAKYQTRLWHEGTLPFAVVKPFDAAWALGLALGDVTESTVDTSAYQYVIVPETSAKTLLSFSLEEDGYDSYQTEYPGCVVRGLSGRLTPGGLMTLDMDVVACGAKTTGAGSASLITDEDTMRGSVVYAWIGDGWDAGGAGTNHGTTNLDATPTDVQAKIREVRFGITNLSSLDHMFDFTSQYPVRNVRDSRRTFELSFTIEQDDHTYVDYLHDATEFAFEVQWKSASLAGAAAQYQGFVLAWPKCWVRDISLPFAQGGRLVNRVTCEVGQDSTDGQMQCLVWSKTTGIAQ
jgi:hypothetical protein